MRIYLITYTEKDPATGKMRTLISHGIDREQNSIPMPWEDLEEIDNVKFDVQCNMYYIEE